MPKSFDNRNKLSRIAEVLPNRGRVIDHTMYNVFLHYPTKLQVKVLDLTPNAKSNIPEEPLTIIKCLNTIILWKL